MENEGGEGRWNIAPFPCSEGLGVGWGYIESLKIRGPYRVDVAGRGHDRGSRPVWVSMPEVSTFFLAVSIVR